MERTEGEDVKKKRVLRNIFGPEREEVTGENCIMWSFRICTHHQIL
jgi:hypothetical protein